MTFLRRWLRVPMPPRTRANAQVDFLAAILYGAFGGLTLSFILVMGRRLGATPLQVSLLVAAPAIVFLLSFWIVNAVRPVHPVRLVMWPGLLGRLLFLFMPLIKTPAPYVGPRDLAYPPDRYGVSPFPAGILRVRVRGMADQPGGSHSPGGRPARHELPGWPAGGSDVGPVDAVVLLLGEDDRPADGDQYHEGRV